MENLEIFPGRLMVVAFIKFGLDELLAVCRAGTCTMLVVRFQELLLVLSSSLGATMQVQSTMIDTTMCSSGKGTRAGSSSRSTRRSRGSQARRQQQPTQIEERRQSNQTQQPAVVAQPSTTTRSNTNHAHAWSLRRSGVACA